MRYFDRMPARKPDGNLKRGWTTGACATAATAAAYEALVTGSFPDAVTITLPRGEEPTFALCRTGLENGAATAAVIKDAGDDPDVTHGAEVSVTLRAGPKGSGVTFRAGAGVGTVTLPGLPVPPGEPAINPGPRGMMTGVVRDLSHRLNGPPDVEITVAITDGARLAEKTMNGRLGIVGGLSVLGTTGVVIPYSCSSWIHAIHRGVDVARANGVAHIAAATGSTSEQAVRNIYDLPDVALIDMGDFAGGLLKYLRRHPVPKLTLAGGFGKLAKLSQGHLDLHSARSSLDRAKLAALAADDPALADRIKGANTGMEALTLARAAGLPLADRVAQGAREVALAALAGDVEVEVLAFDRQGQLVGRAGDVAAGG
ncbi:MAG: cobalt-precorrin-5B (C(1))-methyltransferase [Rhodospirillales bacterium CG15_BIG_FIL_POST_REV_8_21_14_020_66_15]|nr:MAG: cobalt-precorrin-5B (C(1))-methyltransferase [Rhodospirillales bacterium CG15_BIG_FIL_POST_REV_8_21_14_020_66_15]